MFRIHVSCAALVALSMLGCRTKKTPPPELGAATTDAGVSVAAAASAPAYDPTEKDKPVPAPADVATPPADAERTSSGLYMKVLERGAGEDRPRLQDHVRVDFLGWTRAGKMFERATATVPMADLIPAWKEALQFMLPGEKRRLWVTPQLAHGDPPPERVPKGDLTYEVQLLEVIRMPERPPVTPPRIAKRTKSGLVYEVLHKGSGTHTPGPKDMVRVNYVGWMQNGHVFQSSLPNKKPETVRVDYGMRGWTEGVQMMREGDRMRFWIPADLAYGEKAPHPRLPSGPLMFQIELVAIVRNPH